MRQALKVAGPEGTSVGGEFVDFLGERCYLIRNADQLSPFFMSLVSSSDHWLFLSSTGGITAGRVSPETALFPYLAVDKIHHGANHTGSKTIVRVTAAGGTRHWEPFNREHDGIYRVTRNIYKSIPGDKVCFEEINHEFDLAYRYTWMTSHAFGFIRRSELENLGSSAVAVEILDGLQDVMAAGTPRFVQTNASNLVNAHRWTELDEETGLGVFALSSGISDRPEPSESLRANTVFCIGIEPESVLLSSEQIPEFRRGRSLRHEARMRGIRGAFLVNASMTLAAGEEKSWRMIANVEQTQAQVVALRRQLQDSDAVAIAVDDSLAEGADALKRIMAAADSIQVAQAEHVTAHHYSSVVFNVLRGGVFNDQYRVPTQDYAKFVEQFNRRVFERNAEFLAGLPGSVAFPQLLEMTRAQGDSQLERLTYEYLPIGFGRRHGDPSRPWNSFEIRLSDETGGLRLSFEGNWRDIFQNWEALAFSYPEFIENFIAKFVNASTIDGYNAYRLTRCGIDWEVEDPGNPWSNIGYWGDHQIIYLLKLLELSDQFHPNRLRELLRQKIFCYANVPYRLKPFESLLDDPKHTVLFDHDLAAEIDRRVADFGADGKLILDAAGEVYRVCLLEKLLVPLLSKLGNLVIDGGVWLNTQRPEWNDANNALVGHGLSMVTLCYLRRYVRFLQNLLEHESEEFPLSGEVAAWFSDTKAVLRTCLPLSEGAHVSAEVCSRVMSQLGEAASRYRAAVYSDAFPGAVVKQPVAELGEMLDDALDVIDHSIVANRRDDGLYHSYNLFDPKKVTATIEPLYLMLEGQVAALSSGAVDTGEAIAVVESLFESDVYRADQHSFMLYPDRDLPGFLDKNRIPDREVESIHLLQRMDAEGDDQLVVRDTDGCYRFHPDFRNARDLQARLDELVPNYGDEVESSRSSLLALYEQVYKHKAFTGRSGAMFGFEGLGSIYWHMVSKLLLAIQEVYFRDLDSGGESTDRARLGELYYAVREGLGFNKTPAEFGTFPVDPYSHSPKHSGARQPGMTGQVKEDILSRFGELGIRVRGGRLSVEPALLKGDEFLAVKGEMRFLDTDGLWQEVTVPPASLAFTWCQVPFLYSLHDADPVLIVSSRDGTERVIDGLELSADDSLALFCRTGGIRQVTAKFRSSELFTD